MERNLTAHEPAAPLPCLCSRCLARAPESSSLEGLHFRRLEVRAASRVLHAWYPVELEDEVPALRASMERRLTRRYHPKHAPAATTPTAGTPPTQDSGPGLFGRLRKLLGF